ncbi:minor tail protein [Rhodobacter phage RcDurkin]|nr:minor tail protein [Rhodobacter phage RcDurkin]QXN72506.1 minor tail protein [Rhodobacter phage RcTiptonus]UUV43780.1 minor tail protein [Rhodobacter phage RcKickapoo]UUV44407.1 minor tail protein [Rhodobacter phage RcMenchie]
MKTTKVFDADISRAVAGSFGPLSGAKGFSGRAETRMTRLMRDELRKALMRTVVNATKDFSKSGRARAQMLEGIRTFGQNFNNLRGHIMGPVYIKAHEDGTTIVPDNAEKLAIPLPAALRADGRTPKLPGPNSWRNVGSFIFKSKKTGHSYVAYRAADKSLVLLYLLVDEVTLKEHSGFLRKAWNRQVAPLGRAMGRIMMEEISKIDVGKLARVK